MKYQNIKQVAKDDLIERVCKVLNELNDVEFIEQINLILGTDYIISDFSMK